MDDELTVQVALRVNGEAQEMSLPTSTLLADLLRDGLGLLGVKVACGRGVCGSCTCLVDGSPVASCSVFAWDVDGADVETVEGFGADGALDVVQQAFVDCSAFQCGYCTAGMVTLSTALLREHPDPDPALIRSWISSNICRCTGYESILEAVALAAEHASASGEK